MSAGQVTWQELIKQLDRVIKECGGSRGIDSRKDELLLLLQTFDAVNQRSHFEPYIHFDDSG